MRPGNSALMAALIALASGVGESISTDGQRRNKPERERKFTDARIAAAEAKRLRKNAKRIQRSG